MKEFWPYLIFQINHAGETYMHSGLNAPNMANVLSLYEGHNRDTVYLFIMYVRAVVCRISRYILYSSDCR